jgi:hypothetical protein
LHWRIEDQPAGVNEALSSPLFVILTAIFITIKNIYRQPSPSELINFWVENKLRKFDKRIADARSYFETIAKYELNSPSSSLDRTELPENAPTQELMATGLIRESGRKYSFSLRILAEWFGAESLRRSIREGQTVNLDPSRLDEWLPSLKLFMQDANASEVNKLPTYILDTCFFLTCLNRLNSV